MHPGHDLWVMGCPLQWGLLKSSHIILAPATFSIHTRHNQIKSNQADFFDPCTSVNLYTPSLFFWLFFLHSDSKKSSSKFIFSSKYSNSLLKMTGIKNNHVQIFMKSECATASAYKPLYTRTSRFFLSLRGPKVETNFNRCIFERWFLICNHPNDIMLNAPAGELSAKNRWRRFNYLLI